MAARSHRERRSAHRTRYFIDGLTAVEIAFVVLLQVMVVKTSPVTAKAFHLLLTDVLKSETGMSAGTRANLEKIRKIVGNNNRKGGLH